MRGIKGIDIGFSNTIVSWGFEAYLNIWAPDYSIVRPFSGSLQSLNMIVDAKCIHGSTIIVSLDSKNAVRIWDQRRMLCIQSFVMPQGNLGILTLKQGFIVYGRKMTLFEMASDHSNQEELQRLSCIPRDIYLNFFYGILLVLTPTQLRIHNAKTGRLQAVHNLIFDSPHDNFMTSFCRSNDRKVYVGNSEGSINLVNMLSGGIIKQVYAATKDNTPITKMFFFKDEHILVAASERLESFDEMLL